MTNVEYFAGFSSALGTYTASFNEIVIQKILQSERYADEPERFYFTLISKINGTLDVSNLLISNFHSHPHFHPSLFILLRSILSDIIVGEYVKMIPSNPSETIDLINSIYRDHIHKTFKSISGIYAVLDEWSPADIAKEKQKIIDARPEYFDAAGNLNFKFNPLSHHKMITDVFSKKGKEDDFSVFRDIFSNYDLFSKYEHLGELSFKLIHNPYTIESTREQFADVCRSVGIIVVALMGYCMVWEDILLDEIEILKKLIQKLYYFDLDKIAE